MVMALGGHRETQDVMFFSSATQRRHRLNPTRTWALSQKVFSASCCRIAHGLQTLIKQVYWLNYGFNMTWDAPQKTGKANATMG
jgi:hypothetical protein